MRWNISCRQSSWIILCFVNSIAGEKIAFNRILGRETAKTFFLTCLCLDYITKDTVEDEHYCLSMRYYYFMHRWISYSCHRIRSLYYVIKISSAFQDQLSITIFFIIFKAFMCIITISKLKSQNYLSNARISSLVIEIVYLFTLIFAIVGFPNHSQMLHYAISLSWHEIFCRRNVCLSVLWKLQLCLQSHHNLHKVRKINWKSFKRLQAITFSSSNEKSTSPEVPRSLSSFLSQKPLRYYWTEEDGLIW